MATMPRTVAVDDRSDNGVNHAEVGVEEGDDIVDLFAEDKVSAVRLRLTILEAQELIHALYDAIGVAELNQAHG